MAIIFLILLFIFPLGEITRFQFGNGIAITLNDISVALTVVTWFISQLFKKKEVKVPLLKPIVIFTGFGLLALIINISNLNPLEFSVSFLYLFRWVMYAGIYFVVHNFDLKFKQKIPYALTISGMVIVLMGFVQYFFYPSLRNLYYLGWDEHLYRMFSSFLDPNFLGVFLVLFLLLILDMLLNFIKKRQTKLLFIFLFLGIAVFAAIILTFSRSAYISLLFSATMLAVLKNKKKWILGIFVVLFLVLILSLTNSKIENQNLFRLRR